MDLSRKRKTPERSELSESAPQISRISHKMDLEKIKQCLIVLKKLMSHPFGWVFNQPVDPVKLQIPDYFTIISHPMDLGTVRQKLVTKKYFGTGQFSQDVRLTFSNAMCYNPPQNEVHEMAKRLNNIFNSGWKLLEEKWAKENPKFDRKPNFVKENPNLSKRAKLAAQSPVGAKPSEIVRKSGQGSVRASCKGENANGHTISGVRTEKSNYNSHINSKNNNVERSNSREGNTQSSASCKNDAPATRVKLLKVPINGTRSRSDDNGRFDSLPSTAPQVNDEIPLIEPMSPSRALRAAMLKSRFADTIVKAQQKTLLDQNQKLDPARLKLERQKLERRQLEEKARIEAAQAAARVKRQKEREAARIALQKMEKTVELDNSELLREVERFVRFTANITLERFGLFMKNDDFDEDLDDCVSANDDLEEGEIF